MVYGKGLPKGGLKLRAVEMRRPGRHTHSTFFGTNLTLTMMSPSQVADAYLSRWSHQEHVFRNTRNGLGLGKTHGYGGECVQHVALDTKLEEAERRRLQTQERYRIAQESVVTATQVQARAGKARKEQATNLLQIATAEEKVAKTALDGAKGDLQALQTTPRVIYQRDTGRENIVTALRMTVMTLIEFVLREYFGGLKMELRTFIEQFVNLPVTVRTSRTEIHYQIEGNPRNPTRTDQMRKACEDITRRKIQRNGKTLRFEVVDPDEDG